MRICWGVSVQCRGRLSALNLLAEVPVGASIFNEDFPARSGGFVCSLCRDLRGGENPCEQGHAALDRSEIENNRSNV